jgi:DNA adenine methylase
MDASNIAASLSAALERVSKREDSIVLERTVPILKGTRPDDERFVLGIVLEPETRDAQDDVISEEEIRRAAHTFMEKFGTRGLMHRENISHRGVKILESYIAPCDLLIGGVRVRKGTWLMGWRVGDDALWSEVKEGRLTGFSIGGSGRRSPA